MSKIQTEQAYNDNPIMDPDNINDSKQIDGNASITLEDGPLKPPSNNVKNHIVTVETLQAETVQELLEIKKDAEGLRQDTNKMRDSLLKYMEEIKHTLTPTMEHILKEIKVNINGQKDENTSLQVQITELRKENSVLQQLILVCGQKLTKLEGTVGSYRNKP